MHRLKDAIPRAYRDHRGRAGRTYGDYVRAVLARFGGTVPADARPALKEAGRLVVQLDQLNADLDQARARRRRRDQARLRRALVIARSQFVTLERRLEERLDGHRARPEHLEDWLGTEPARPPARDGAQT